MNDLPLNELYLMVPIVALLPLSSLMLVLQVSPYQALVIRGIVGAIAALVYALLGAADVALTEALVGTMLSITLYAIAVRSSMSIKVGVREADEAIFSKVNGKTDRPKDLVPSPISKIQELCTQHHMRLEPVYYADASDLKQALSAKEVHAILSPQPDECSNGGSSSGEQSDRLQVFYQFQTRVPRLYEILDAQFEHPELLLAELNSTNGDRAPKQSSNSANRKTVSKVG